MVAPPSRRGRRTGARGPMTAAAGVAYRSLMRTTSEAPARRTGAARHPAPGRPSDVAVAVLVGVAQLGLTTGAAQGQPDRQPLDLLAYLLLAAGPVALLWRWRSRSGCWWP